MTDINRNNNNSANRITKKTKTKLLYLARSSASGPVIRALALKKAIERLGLAAEIDFAALVLSPYSWLLKEWGVPEVKIDAPLRNLELVTQKGMEAFKPDILISSYIIREPQALMAAMADGDCQAWLLLRHFLDYGDWLSRFDFKSEMWQGVVAIEPGIRELVEPHLHLHPQDANLLEEVAPVLATWPDELLPEDEARKALLEMSGVRDYGRPICLVMHNGRTGGAEMQAITDQVRRANISYQYQVLYFSQDPASPGAGYPTQLARYFGAVKRLMAAPGYNTFWEWQRFGPADDSESVWIPQSRTFEDQEARTKLSFDRKALGEQENGAETLIRKVFEANKQESKKTSNQE